MTRRKTHTPLNVFQNNRFVGRLQKEPSGAISFAYDESWLDWPHAWPISLSLPMRPTAYKGEAVIAVFDNLLPDSDAIRRRVAERLGAAGTDAYSLLSVIGRDCVGAMQFLPEDELPPEATGITGEPVDDEGIEHILKGLARAPLGLDQDDGFRISIAGAQEKTALLWHEGRWMRPTGTTPTTHIFKTQIGSLNGIDLTNSVENEFYCLKLIEAFGFKVCKADMQVFGETKALVVERFDRIIRAGGQFFRLPQEDCCQALGIPSTRKYQNQGGPGIVQIMDLLRRSSGALFNAARFFEAQVIFWLIGATDGHAKNFSIRLFPGGDFEPTPLYDILSTQPLVDKGQLDHNNFKLAMSVGEKTHYRINTIHKRHFVETAQAGKVPFHWIQEIFDRTVANVERAIEVTANALPTDFPHEIRHSIESGVRKRANSLI